MMKTHIVSSRLYALVGKMWNMSNVFAMTLLCLYK